jgi:N6-L-threonylcarbamoyladenine synthase
MRQPGLVLGIETSCDETSAAVVAGGTRILSNIIASQVDLHQKYGGVVPEIASRKHLETLIPCVAEALAAAGVGLGDLGAVALTCGPGLAGALMVGVTGGKALAYAAGLDLVGVNHLEGHIYANFLDSGPAPEFPLVCLVVSGGHTDLILMKAHGSYEVLGRSRDDAAGEAYDKVARLLGLGYPGGPLVDALAQEGNADAVALPQARLEEGSLDTSFSGLKTAVSHVVGRGSHRPEDIAASFQKAVASVLSDKAFDAVRRTGARMLALAGGVSANSELRRTMISSGERLGVAVRVPPARLCTDNAAMIASCGHHRLQRGSRSGWDLNALPNLALGDESIYLGRGGL